jgi:hypothetical protein
MRQVTQWKWHRDEVFVKFEGGPHLLGRVANARSSGREGQLAPV